MAVTIAKQKKKEEASSNGSPLIAMRDFPSLMRRMQSEFDELFDRFAKTMPLSIEDLSRNWSWGLEVDDKEDCVVIRAEAPGFESGDFDLRTIGDRLVLRANRCKEEKGKEGESREEHRCYESMLLPPGVDTEKIEAKYQNGILTVTIPKTAEGRGKKIDIKSS